MTLPINVTLAFALSTVQATANSAKIQAGNMKTSLSAANADSQRIFLILDRLRSIIDSLNLYVGLTGLDAFARSNIPNYSGTLTSDIAAVVSSAQACINWIVTSFPKDSTNTYILAEILNADGTRTQRQFTPVQTAGLQSALQTLVDLIG